MSLVPPVLNPSSLYKEEAKRDATRIKIYNGVLTQIYNKVKAVARIPGNQKALWYVVPEFLPGYPRFNTGEAVIYIVWNLRNAGYQVEYTHPNLLLISWKSHDDHYHQTDSPWSQVLQMAKTNKPEPQKSIFVESLRPAEKQPDRTIEVAKRKSVLKKTVEYQPITSSKPNVYASMYPTPAPVQTSPAPPKSTLPGQLSDKHVSFV